MPLLSFLMSCHSWSPGQPLARALRPRLSVLCLPSSPGTLIQGWPYHQPHLQPAAHCDMASTLLGLVPGVDSSSMALARCYFSSLSLCQCPCGKSHIPMAKWLRTGVHHGLVASCSGPLALEGEGGAATSCWTTGKPCLAVPVPALFPVLSPSLCSPPA